MWQHLVLVGSLSALLLAAGEKIHVVEKGDTLYQISREYHVSVDELRRANPKTLGDNKSLKVGAKLRIPTDEPTTPPAQPAKPESDSKPNAKADEGDSVSKEESTDEEKEKPTPAPDENAQAPATYVVRKGDTISAISRRFKISPGELREINGIKGNILRIGQRLKVRAAISSGAVAPVKTSGGNLATGGQSASRPPVGETKQRYLFIDKVKDKIDAPRVVPGRWKYVVVHHSGTPSGNARIFDYFHKNIRGMENGLAYHFVIGNGRDSGDGEIEVGNRWAKQLQGGHLHSDELNEIAIGICFVGDFNSDRPTKKQIASAIELITYLNKICGKPPVFKAHREINPRPTECPGKNFPVRAFHELFDHQD